jgi:hypothetical protein
LSALATQFLGALRVIPDGGAFELASYFFESLALDVEVKDTP